jgi:hypothetical protein
VQAYSNCRFTDKERRAQQSESRALNANLPNLRRILRVCEFHHVLPIADQHVFRASRHKQLEGKQDWDTCQSYRAYFQQIAEAVGVDLTVENVPELKRIDNALFEFGKFLSTCDRALKGSASAASAAN